MNDRLAIDKKSYSKTLKNFCKFTQKNKSTGLIVLKDEVTIDFLLDWLEELSSDFVIQTQKEYENRWNIFFTSKLKKDFLPWIDYILVDEEVEELSQYFSQGIVPIIPQNHHLVGILKEFDPLTSKWNSFFYKNWSSWSVYASLVRYLENTKFPYDHKALVENILKT